MSNKLTYQTGEPDIFVGGGNVKILLPGTEPQAFI